MVLEFRVRSILIVTRVLKRLKPLQDSSCQCYGGINWERVRSLAIRQRYNLTVMQNGIGTSVELQPVLHLLL